VRSEVESQRGRIAELCRRYRVIRLEVFGSAATERDFDDESDVDFLYEMEKGPGYAARFFDFKDALEELLGRPVDLVHDASIDNPFFRESVDASRQLVYAA
jgi:predicted nucleotidyltransferase